MKIFRNGLLTGLVLQLAIGPIFFYIINLTLQKTVWDGLAGGLAAMTVDYFYITLSVLGIGKLLEKERFKKIFGLISSIVLMAFGIFLIKEVGANMDATPAVSASLFSSYISVFLLTISSPLTIVVFTSIFTARAVEYGYTKKELYTFGLGTGLATIIFMGSSVILFSFIKEAVPVLLIHLLNLLVGILLIGYGGFRLWKILK